MTLVLSILMLILAITFYHYSQKEYNRNYDYSLIYNCIAVMLFLFSALTFIAWMVD